jgi:hypothetical protein
MCIVNIPMFMSSRFLCGRTFVPCNIRYLQTDIKTDTQKDGEQTYCRRHLSDKMPNFFTKKFLWYKMPKMEKQPFLTKKCINRLVINVICSESQLM